MKRRRDSNERFFANCGRTGFIVCYWVRIASHHTTHRTYIIINDCVVSTIPSLCRFHHFVMQFFLFFIIISLRFLFILRFVCVWKDEYVAKKMGLTSRWIFLYQQENAWTAYDLAYRWCHSHTDKFTHKCDEMLFYQSRRSWMPKEKLIHILPNFPIIQGLNSVRFSSFPLFPNAFSFRLIEFV